MEEKTKKGNALYIVIVVLLVIIFFLGGIVVGQSNLFSKNDDKNQNNGNNEEVKEPTNNDNKDDNKEENKETVIDLDVNSEEVQNLVKKAINVYNTDGEYFYRNYFYKKDKTVLKDEPQKLRLSLSTESIKDKVKLEQNNKVAYLSEEEVQNAFTSLYGNTISYSRSSFILKTVLGTGFEWSDAKNRYEQQNKDGGGMVCDKTYSKIGYAKKTISSSKDAIDVYEYVAFNFCDSSYYSDYQGKTLVAQVNGQVMTNDEFFNKYQDKAGIYKYTFEKDSNGTYAFVSVEKVK